MAALLGVGESIQEVEANYHKSCKECCRTILTSWAKSGCGHDRYPFTWDGLYKLLIDLEYFDTGNKLMSARHQLTQS